MLQGAGGVVEDGPDDAGIGVEAEREQLASHTPYISVPLTGRRRRGAVSAPPAQA